MKFVVTGALGHIGSALTRYIASAFPGSNVIMIDNMAAQRYCSLFDLPKTARYQFIEGNVRELSLDDYFKDADVVIHLAAITDAAGSFGNAHEVEQNNYESTLCVAAACVRTGVAMIFPSSTSVYGVQDGEVDETCSIDDLKPQSPYAESKLKEEAHLSELARTQGLDVAICRFGTIFGTSVGMRFHTAVNKFCWQAVAGQPITVWSTAYDQYRPYLAVSDAVRAIHFIIENRLYSDEVINVVSNNHTVREVVESITNLCPTVEVGFVDSRIMNQLSYKVRNRKLLNAGFEVQGVLEAGISDTIQLLRQSNSLRSQA